MKGKSFEDLHVWQKSRELVNLIYEFTKKDKFSKDWALTDQMRRAVISIMSNIAEGFERGSNVEFIQFLYIAKGSCGEVRSQSYIAYDQNYVTEKELTSTNELSKQVSAMISNLIKYLKGSQIKGPKFTR